MGRDGLCAFVIVHEDTARQRGHNSEEEERESRGGERNELERQK